jgi:hypothetical protein
MSATHDVVHLLPLAAKEVDTDKVTPGLLGFLVFALIGLAAWGLMKSMNKQMKKIDFEEAPAVPRQAKAAPGKPAAAERSERAQPTTAGGEDTGSRDEPQP